MNQTNQPLYFILLGALGFAVFSIQLQHSVIQNVDGTNRNSNAYLGAPTFATNRTADKWNSTSSHMGRSKKNKNASQVFLNSLMQSTLIPLKPDPRVMTNIAKAWTEENGTEQMYLKDDPNLKNVRKGGKCPVTSQIQLNTLNDNWTLVSLDHLGNRKTIGGDEYYVTYQDEVHNVGLSPTAVAYANDQENGVYQLDFVQSPFHLLTNLTGSGLLTINLQYTCGLGKLEHGTKRIWSSGGALMVQYNIVAAKAPPIRVIKAPNSDGNVDLGKYDEVLIYGDSNLSMFYLSAIHQHPNLRFLGRPEAPLNTQSMIRKHLKVTRQMLSRALIEDPDKKLALLTGSSTWDIIVGVKHGKDFKSHRKACQVYMETLHNEFPSVDLFWFSGLAIHVHAIQPNPKWYQVVPLKYMSMSRASMLYRWQMEIMNSMDFVKVIDVFEASYLSAEHMLEGDARHFDSSFHIQIADWYFPQIN